MNGDTINNLFVSTDAFVENNVMWGITEDTDLLYSINLITGEMNSCDAIPGRKSDLYGVISMRNTPEYIYLSSCEDKRLLRYSKKKRRFFDCFSVERIRQILEKESYIMFGAFEETLLLYLSNRDSLVYIENDTWNVEEDSQFLDKLKTKKIKPDGHLFETDFLQCKNIIYVPLRKYGCLLEFDITGRNWDIQILPRLNETELIAADEDISGEFVLTMRNGACYVWKKNKRLDNVLGPVNTEDDKSYGKAYICNGNVYLIPYYEREVYFVNNNKKTIIDFEYPANENFAENVYEQYRAIFKYKDRIYFQVRSNGQLFYIDTAINQIKECKIRIRREEKMKILEKTYRERGMPEILYEKGEYSVEAFLKGI